MIRLHIGQTTIQLHPAMLLCYLYAALTGHMAFILLASGSIFLHEVAHALVSASFGEIPRSIELTALGAVMRLDDEGLLPPVRQLLVLAAGPALSLILCWLAILLTENGILLSSLGRQLFMSNLSILIINLLPAFPLDGGRILYLVLRTFCPARITTGIMRLLGSGVGIILILSNLYTSWRFSHWNLSLAFSGCCILYSTALGTTTHAAAELREFVDRKIRLERKGSARVVIFQVLTTLPLSKLVRKLPARKTALFLCAEAGSMQATGWMTENEAIQHYLSAPQMTVGQAITLCRNIHFDTKADTI